MAAVWTSALLLTAGFPSAPQAAATIAAHAECAANASTSTEMPPAAVMAARCLAPPISPSTRPRLSSPAALSPLGLLTAGRRLRAAVDIIAVAKVHASTAAQQHACDYSGNRAGNRASKVKSRSLVAE
jgi:hypothetical protein